MNWYLNSINSLSGNVALGLNALGPGSIPGFQNIAIGGDSFKSLSSGSANIGIGYQSGVSNTVGSRNIFIGAQAGSSVTTGSHNVIIGGNNGATIATLSNNVIVADGSGNERLRIDGKGRMKFEISDTTNLAANDPTGYIFSALSQNQKSILNIESGLNGATALTRFASKDNASSPVSYLVGVNVVDDIGAFDIYDQKQGVSRLHILPNGNVGIGTTYPSAPLHVNVASGMAATFTNNSSQMCSITPGNGSMTCSSDSRLKKDITPITDAWSLDKILALEPVTYRWRQGDEQVHSGFIAQELEKVIPELVTEDARGYKQVSYAGLVPFLTGAMKSIYAEVQALFKKTEQQSAELSSLQTENGLLKQQNLELNERMLQLEQQNALIKAHLCAKDPAAAFCQ
jgi:hypothetical protein